MCGEEGVFKRRTKDSVVVNNCIEQTTSTSECNALVAAAAGVHPATSRTRQLSPPARMVLRWRRRGRVRSCQRATTTFFIVSERGARERA